MRGERREARGMQRIGRMGLMAALLCAGAWGMSWVETSQQDFSDGAPDNNLYVSYRDSGTVEFAPRFDLNNDGYMDMVCPDDSGPYLRVYFGSATGYDSARSRYFDVSGGGGIDIADLNTDGYAELVHSGWHARNVVIYWGSDSGPSATDTTWLSTGGQSEAVTIADLDRDSYLDIIAGTDSGDVYVFWGSYGGYASSDTSVITLGGRIGHDLGVADFDNDGWADIAAVRWNRDSNAVIYWGPGRHARAIAWLPIPDGKPHGTTVADFNRDGWLDIAGNVYDDALSAYVYYGSESGFAETRRDVIHPGPCYGGSAAAYWDADTSLDLVFFRGNYDTTVTMVPQVFFNDLGSATHFSDANQADIGTQGFNASGGLVADFNQDGAADVFIDGYNGGEPSVVLWGPGWTGCDTLPAAKSHHGAAREVGNAYDRRFRERYVSSVFGGSDTVVWRKVAWQDTTPGSSAVELELRTGNTPVPGPEWTEWQPYGNGDTIPSYLASSRIQYRATLRYDKPAVLPMLYAVQVDYDSLPFFDVGPTTIVAPIGNVDSGTTVVPRAVVRNFGNQPATFPVTMLIGASYNETVTESLGVGGSDTASFPQWIAEPVGVTSATCYTVLVGDQNRYNDTITAGVQVVRPPRPDVGATAILAPPDSVDSGTVITPRAVVRNFGPLAARFPVVLSIGPTYADTVSDSLDVGQSDSVAFADWTALELGTHPIVCFTDLVGDGNRANDTIADSVRVVALPIPDMAALEILAPRGFADSGVSYVPAAVVRNLGPLAAVFPVTMAIGAGYQASVVETLAAGISDTLTFSNWTAEPMETLDVIAYTALAGDPNPGNDTVRATVIVGPPARHDIGVEQVGWDERREARGERRNGTDGEARAGDTLKPRALVRNYGARPERFFDVRFRIGAAYSRTANVSVALEPDSAVEVSFPAWVAVAGTYSVSCSTMLTVDEDRTNDKETLSLTVARFSLLHVEPDQSDTVATDSQQTYRFYAELESDSARVIDIGQSDVPPAWAAVFYDSADVAPLGGTLGLAQPGRHYWFSLRVNAPPGDLAGMPDTLSTRAFVVRGWVHGDTTTHDSAVLTLALAPLLTVHNFPNPCEGSTRFIIGLPEPGTVRLTLYDRAGARVRLLRDKSEAGAGVLLLDWDGTNDAGKPVASGNYRYVMDYSRNGTNSTIVKKLVLVRK